VLLAKAVASVLVAAAATVVTSVVAVVGNLIGAKVAGITRSGTAGTQATRRGLRRRGSRCLIKLLTGFTLGALIRNSAGAVVSYMVYAFVAPGLLALLAMSQEWFRTLRPWVDAKFTPRTH